MVVAGLDKVVKSYVATEFLHDYLKERKTVCGAEHAAGRRARDRVLGKRADVSIEPLGDRPATPSEMRGAVESRAGSRPPRASRTVRVRAQVTSADPLGKRSDVSNAHASV